MEGSESEAVFNSLNLNPQLFINEALNTVDDLVDEAFNFYHQEASTLLKTEGTERSQDVSKGATCIRNMIQSALDKRLGMWEKYCLYHCFAVPEGFFLPTNELPCESSMQGALYDPDLDGQLDSLRDKLTMAAKESASLSRELRILETETSSSDRCAMLAAEALQFYEHNSVHNMFQEMVKTASELRMKMDNLKARRKENMQPIRTERIYNPKKELCVNNPGKGLYIAKLEDLQDFVAEVKNM